METSAVILLVVSCAISFGLGRTIVYFRNKKRAEKAAKLAEEMERNRPEEPESKNKGKRKRQLQRMGKNASGR